MPDFEFNVDVKYACWDRYPLKIEADNFEEAVRKVNTKYFVDNCLSGQHNIDATEIYTIGDFEYLSPEENKGEYTEELSYDSDTGKKLWDNVHGWVPDTHDILPERLPLNTEVHLAAPFAYTIGEKGQHTGKILQTVEDCIEEAQAEMNEGIRETLVKLVKTV